MILFMRSKLKTTPPLMGKAPPLNPVLAPEGVTGINCSLQYFSRAETSFVVEGCNTTSGINNKSSVSSCPYFFKMSLSTEVISLKFSIKYCICAFVIIVTKIIKKGVVLSRHLKQSFMNLLKKQTVKYQCQGGIFFENFRVLGFVPSFFQI